MSAAVPPTWTVRPFGGATALTWWTRSSTGSGARSSGCSPTNLLGSQVPLSQPLWGRCDDPSCSPDLRVLAKPGLTGGRQQLGLSVGARRATGATTARKERPGRPRRPGRGEARRWRFPWRWWLLPSPAGERRTGPKVLGEPGIVLGIREKSLISSPFRDENIRATLRI